MSTSNKNLFFLFLAGVCIWILLDEFVGGGRLSAIVNNIVDSSDSIPYQNDGSLIDDALGNKQGSVSRQKAIANLKANGNKNPTNSQILKEMNRLKQQTVDAQKKSVGYQGTGGSGISMKN